MKKTKTEKHIDWPYVHFQDVGPRKLHWGTRISRPVTDAKIVAEIRKRKALGSREIDVDFAYSDHSATVYVGMFRPVGRVLLVPSSAGRPEAEILADLREAGVTR